MGRGYVKIVGKRISQGWRREDKSRKVGRGYAKAGVEKLGQGRWGRGYVKVVGKRFRQGRWEDVSDGQIRRGQIIAGGESQDGGERKSQGRWPEVMLRHSKRLFYFRISGLNASN